MAFEKICSVDDVAAGGMGAFATADGTRVLLVRLDGGVMKAYYDRCPHQHVALSEGMLEANLLTCRAHEWQFDVSSGRGVNPETCTLAEYPVRISDRGVYVDVAVRAADRSPGG